MNKSLQKKIIITTGDTDGIGFEVSAKALLKLGPQKDCLFYLFRPMDLPDESKRYLHQLQKKFAVITSHSLSDAMKMKLPFPPNTLIDIASEMAPPQWVEESAIACHKGFFAAMVTAPLSKTSIQEVGYSDLGHTDILKRISRAKYVHMGFIGKYFNVVLATGHIPLSEVSHKLNFKSLSGALLNANELRLQLKNKLKPIGVLGLNPHAGETGLIGTNEVPLFKNLQAFAKENKIPMEGPLVPDAAFLKKNWSRYSVFLTLYHDQGLIPFKTVHGQDSGVHITLGLPFLRTSVDHGTAKDIFGLNKANAHSMTEALQWALTSARQG